MDYNPHAQRYAAARTQLQSAQRRRDQLKAEWDRMTARSLLDVQGEHIRTLEAHVASLDRETRIRETLVEMDRRTVVLRAAIGSSWNPRNWFDKVQAALRAKLATHLQDRATLAKEAAKFAKDHKALKEKASRLEQEIAVLEKFDRARAEKELAEAVATVAALEPEAKAALAAYDAAAAVLDEHVAALASAQKELSHYESAVARATYLQAQLEAAATPRDRALVHEACRQDFDGMSNPGAVVGRMSEKRESARRAVQKAKVRVEGVVARITRDVRTVVIDGNNLCYQGEKFIGLRALAPAVAELATRYAVVVAFDQGICQRLRISRQDLSRAFGDTVQVHVVSGKADETILSAASSETAYVISRDQFSEFRDKDAVRGRRVLRHEIINDRVMIHDLGIDLPLAR